MRVIRWEYQTRKLTNVYKAEELTRKLNLFGDDGYELVCIARLSENGDNYVIFKRPIGYLNVGV